jgi:hypothetical protein
MAHQGDHSATAAKRGPCCRLVGPRGRECDDKQRKNQESAHGVDRCSGYRADDAKTIWLTSSHTAVAPNLPRRALMSLTLYFHPLASFCHKVLVALYESSTPFQGRIVDLGDASDRAELTALWPVGKFPV